MSKLKFGPYDLLICANLIQFDDSCCTQRPEPTTTTKMERTIRWRGSAHFIFRIEGPHRTPCKSGFSNFLKSLIMINFDMTSKIFRRSRWFATPIKFKKNPKRFFNFGSHFYFYRDPDPNFTKLWVTRQIRMGTIVSPFNYIFRAGHTSQLPRQGDHFFWTKIVAYWFKDYIRLWLLLLYTEAFTFYAFFLVTEALTSCHPYFFSIQWSLVYKKITPSYFSLRSSIFFTH